MAAAPVLVVGRSGQVATELARLGGIAGHPVVARGRADGLDLASAGSIRPALERLAPALVINAAAYTAVDRAESDSEAARALNALGPARLADACAGAAIPLIHLSTDYVFDGQGQDPWREDDPVAPLGVYGRTKAEGEALIRAATPRHVILRTAWVFAAHGHNFVRTMLRLGRERDTLTIVDDQRGGPTPAAAIASACARIAAGVLEGRDDGFGTFHFAGTPAVTWFGFAGAIFAAAARHGYSLPRLLPIPSAAYPTPAPRPANSMLDCSRIERVWGIPRPDWQPALEGVVADLLGEA
jgi:dTDP-4-dehydrorhamnose reductase